MGSKNAHRCAQNTENGFGFDFFLERYDRDGDEFLNQITTGLVTWVSSVNVETDEQSKQWMHTHLPTQVKNFKQMLSACQKDDLWQLFSGPGKGVLMVEFME
jgi:hypothetical protein